MKSEEEGNSDSQSVVPTISQEQIIFMIVELRSMRILLKDNPLFAEKFEYYENFILTMWAKYSVQEHENQELRKKCLALGNFMGLR